MTKPASSRTRTRRGASGSRSNTSPRPSDSKRLTFERVVAVAAVLLTALGVFRPWNYLDSAPPLIGDQLDSIRSEAATAGREVKSVRRVHLHGSSPSYLIVTEPTHVPVVKASKVTFDLSDELTVYDVVDGALHQALQFRPGIEPGPGHGLTLEYRTIAIDDFNHDGEEEILGNFQASSAHPGDDPASGLTYPVGIAWSASTGAYRLSALLRRRPQGLSFRKPDGARSKVRRYRQRVALVDTRTGTSVRTFGSEEATVVDSGRRVFLVVGYEVRDAGTVLLFDPNTGGMDSRHHFTDVVQGHLLVTGGGQPFRPLECISPRLNLLGPIIKGTLTGSRLAKAWRGFLPDSTCR
jgi:hypothetical protein